MLTTALAIDILLLMLAANGAPILTARILGDRWSYPVDGGMRLWDGRPLFGTSKTWRGVIAGLLTAALMAMMLGYGASFGLLFGAASLAGDLCSSFIKRRFGIASSGMAIGLDQVPEALLPLWLGRGTLQLDWSSMAIMVLLFLIGSLVLSRIMFWFGIRKQPY